MDFSKQHVYHYSEEMSGPEGLSGAVWKELAKEFERRSIYEQQQDRDAQEQQKAQLQQQLDLMKLLHPTEFGMRGGSESGRPMPPSSGSCGFTSDGYEGMTTTKDSFDQLSSRDTLLRAPLRPTDRYAGGDHSRTNGGMNWDASGRLIGSPGLSVPSNGHDEWLLSATASHYDNYHHDGDLTEMMSTDTYFSSARSKLPPGALAALHVEPPEIHWPQSEAVRHIIEEEDQQDAQMFALQKSLSRTVDDTESASNYKAHVVGNISTGLNRRETVDSDSHCADSDTYDGPWSVPSASTIRRELELSGSRHRTEESDGPMSATLRMFEQRRRQAAAERATQLRGYRTSPSTEKDEGIDRSTGGARKTEGQNDQPPCNTKRASDKKVLSRIERAVELGLRLRRMTRVSPHDEFDECDC